MASDGVLITQEILEKGLSSRGAFNFEQMECLGVEFPLQKGWRRQLIGRRVSQEAIDRFLALKNAHLPGENKSPADLPDVECSNCKFWSQVTVQQGFCHRYPMYIEKGVDDWCGEFVAHQS